MAEATAGRVALFSIKPRYAEAILTGAKLVEFRRTPLADDVSHVVIYATSPVKRVVGAFEVAGVERDTPRGLWRTYQAVGGIERADYDTYFDGTDNAYAIKVHSVAAWRTPLPLDALSPNLRPPQSYQYLYGSALDVVAPLLGGGCVQSLPRDRVLNWFRAFLGLLVGTQPETVCR